MKTVQLTFVVENNELQGLEDAIDRAFEGTHLFEDYFLLSQENLPTTNGEIEAKRNGEGAR